jgi:hypothetical protein
MFFKKFELLGDPQGPTPSGYSCIGNREPFQLVLLGKSKWEVATKDKQTEQEK